MASSSFDYQVADTLDFNGTGEQTATMKLPKVNFQRMKLQFTYNVTDAGISAGENIDGALTRFLIQTPGFKYPEPIDARRNELNTVYAPLLFEADQPATNLYYDGLPVSTEEQESWVILDWGYNGGQASDNVIFNMSMNALQEWSQASSFTCQVKVFLELGTTDVTECIFRMPRTASTSDDVPNPPLPYVAVLVTAATAGDLTYLKVPNGPEIRSPKGIEANWQQWVESTPTERSAYYYLIVDAVERTDYIRLEATTSEVRTAYYVSNVGWTA